MKKLFTLIGGLLLASGAFAQSEWVNLVTNGDLEGEQDPMWSSFWCHDWRRGVEFNPESGQQYDGGDVEMGQFQGFAEVVEDPKNPGNHCVRVICRSQEEALAAGNMIADGDHIAGWDSQFFVYATEAIPAGKELRLTMRIMAEKDASPGTQAHNLPGDYNHWACVGNPNFTTEWAKWTATITVSNDMVGGVDGDGNPNKAFQSIAFNLADFRDGNIYYFDDIKLEMRDPKGPEEFSGWFNMLRHETLSDDPINNFTNFTGRNGIDNTDRPAEVVTDPIDGQPALKVTSIGWNAQEVKVDTIWVQDENGEYVLDDEGNRTYELEESTIDVYVNEERNERLESIDDWRTQFFVTIPHKFTPNSKYRLVMQARADKPATIQSQVHRMPGDYIYYVGVGDLNLTTEWQDFEFDDQTVSSDQSGSGTFQTIAFNCNVLKEENNYYFRVKEFAANAADVTVDERTLASSDIILPVPEPENQDGASASVNMEEAMKVLEATSFENLINENMTVLSGTDTYGTVDVTAGFNLTDAGLLANDLTPLTIEIEEVSDNNPVLNLTVYNIDGESFEGKSLSTQFCYEYNNWLYVHNVTLIPEAAYAGVNKVEGAKKATGTIYDLSGRKVTKPSKGLYILDGKKFIVK